MLTQLDLATNQLKELIIMLHDYIHDIASAGIQQNLKI